MRSILPSLGLLTAALYSPALCFSQTPSQPVDGRVAEWMYGEHIPTIARAPFTARVELERVNQLADGTLITYKTYNIVARDLRGRTRNEARKWMDATSSEQPRIIRIELYDPQTKTRTNIFPATKTARKWSQAFGPTNTADPAGKSETSRENLGIDTIEGVSVRGQRVNQTYAAGALGNDRPLTISTESWYSEELKINLMTKRTDPRFGVESVRVTELNRQEPDESLFAVPEGYRINDQTVLGQQALDEESSPSRQLPPLPPGVATAGVDGIGVPNCVYCPTPAYSDEARAAKFSGRIVLRVVVTPEGRAENIQVLRGPGPQLGVEQSAIETVSRWQFKPATGPDGKAIAVSVPVEVTFRIR
jgi:TonB family protein